MKPLIPTYLSLSVLVLLQPSLALSNGIQEVRAELADSTVADAAMMALRLCNTGQIDVCPQAAALLCIDGQGSIVSDIMKKVPPGTAASNYEAERMLLVKAFRNGTLSCGKSVVNLAEFFEDRDLRASVIQAKAKQIGLLGASDFPALKQLCAGDSTRSIAENVLIYVPPALKTEAVKKGVACSWPTELEVKGAVPGDDISVNNKPWKAVSVNRLFLPVGEHTLTIQHGGQSYNETVVIGDAPKQSVSLPVIVTINSAVPDLTIDIGAGPPWRTGDGPVTRRVPSGSIVVKAMTPRHKPLTRREKLEPGSTVSITVKPTDLTVRDDISQYEKNANMRLLGWGGIAAGGVALLMSVAQMSEASSLQDDADAAYGEYNDAMQLTEANDLENRTAKLDEDAASALNSAAVLGTLGVALAAGGAYLLFKNPAVKKPAGSVEVGLAPIVTPNFAGTSLTGHF